MVALVFTAVVIALCLSILFGAWDRTLCRYQGCTLCDLCDECHQCGRKLDAKR